MKHIDKVLGNQLANPSDVKRPTQSSELGEQQRRAVVYFFARVRAIDPQQYMILMPDEKTEQLIKQEFSAHVMNFTKDQIDKGMAAWHSLRQEDHKDYKFLNLDKIVGLIANGGNTHGQRAGLYRHVRPGLPVPDSVRQERKKTALAALDSIKGLLDE